MGLLQRMKQGVKNNAGTLKKVGLAAGGLALAGGLAYAGVKAYKAFKGKKSKSSTSKLRSRLKRVKTRIALIRAQRTLEKELSRI